MCPKVYGPSLGVFGEIFREMKFWVESRGGVFISWWRPHVVLVAEGGQDAGGIRDLGDEPSPTSVSNTPQTEPDAGGVGVASVVEVPPLSEGLFTLVKGDGTSHLVELCC